MPPPNSIRYRLIVLDDYDDDLINVRSYPHADPSVRLAWISAPPSGDGQSFDFITGEPTTGTYSVRVIDAPLDDGSRVVTSVLADAFARQQLIGKRAEIEHSRNGDDFVELCSGYVLAVRMISAIEYEIVVGHTRRIEKSYTVFRHATPNIPGVTTVIGGPVYPTFIPGFLENNGGWLYTVGENNALNIKLELKTNGGFDPRKDPTTLFSSVSSAISDYVNDWAYPFFQSKPLGGGTDIWGHFPGIRARLRPSGGTEADDLFLIPLSRPAAWAGLPRAYRIIDDGTDSPLYLPKTATDMNGDTVVFDPATSTDYEVWVYAIEISEANPLHWYGHPVDLWAAMRDDAGIAYDPFELDVVRDRLGVSLRLALRITGPQKIAEVDRNMIYGPFRTTSVVGGGVQRLVNANPGLFPTFGSGEISLTELTLDHLRDDGGTVWQLDESTVVTAVTVKTKHITKWTTSERAAPAVDGLIVRDAYPQTIENSSDDIPEGVLNEVILGDIPGEIWFDGAGPVSRELYLSLVGDELFERFGRGAIECEIRCQATSETRRESPDVAMQLTLTLPHLPGAVVGDTPVSQRGTGDQAWQIVHRTEVPEGVNLKLVNSLSKVIAPDVLPEFTIAQSSLDNERYGEVTITNSDDLFAAGLSVWVDYATGPTEPAEGAGVFFTTILTPFLDAPTHSFEVGPVEEGSKLWVQMRSVGTGFRPGPYTDWDSVTLA